MNRYIAIIFTALLLCSCGGATKRKAQSLPAEQIIAITRTDVVRDTVDMGVVRTGERVSKHLSLRNLTDRPVALLSTETTCGCLQLDFPREPIRSGECVGVELSFDSAGYRFWLPHTVSLNTSAADEPLLIVVTATIK